MPRTQSASTRRASPADRPWDTWAASGWGPAQIALALGFLGAGLVAATIADLVLAPLGAVAVGGAVWVVAFLAPVLLALRRTRPSGLFRVRALDVVLGLLLGVVLRLAAVSATTSDPAGWPSFLLLDGRLAGQTILSEIVIPVVAAPVTEELFFRGLLLVSIVATLRRWGGSPTASVGAAVLISTGLFVVVHVVMGDLSGGADAVSLTVVAVTGAVLVLTTGRIWSAVALHAAYNALAVGAALLGTFVGVGVAIPAPAP